MAVQLKQHPVDFGIAPELLQEQTTAVGAERQRGRGLADGCRQSLPHGRDVA